MFISILNLNEGFMKKFVFVLVVLVFGLVVSGCSSIPLRPATVLSQVNTESVIVAYEESRVVLGIFGDTMYPSAIEIAQRAGITRIATIEYSVTPGLFGLWMTFRTTVSGQ